MPTLSWETLDINPWFVTGYVSAQGSFAFSKYDKTVIVIFLVQTRLRERENLDKIRGYFGNVGSTYTRKSSVIFRVVRANELQRIVTHFDRYPLSGYKQRIYEVWRQMVFSKRQYRKPDSDRLNRLAEALPGMR